jgi:transcriptional regulator with XRE-family HTH domain
MTDSFGARLKREREQRQIALADIAAHTKIKASLFEELERDDASHWPTGIFRRSFIRSYAKALGLDADVVVREFLERFPDPAAEPPAEAAKAPAAAPAPIVDDSGPADTTAHASTAAAQNLRLTLVETGLPFTGGRFLADVRRRWAAAAWDLGSLFAIAVSLFVFMDTFWMPFGVTALCYYVGGILILGNSPGVCLFAPKPTESGTGGPKPSRVPRHRAVDTSPAAVRPAEASFRAVRYRADRHREIRG